MVRITRSYKREVLRRDRRSRGRTKTPSRPSGLLDPRDELLDELEDRPPKEPFVSPDDVTIGEIESTIAQLGDPSSGISARVERVENPAVTGTVVTGAAQTVEDPETPPDLPVRWVSIMAEEDEEPPEPSYLISDIAVDETGGLGAQQITEVAASHRVGTLKSGAQQLQSQAAEVYTTESSALALPEVGAAVRELASRVQTYASAPEIVSEGSIPVDPARQETYRFIILFDNNAKKTAFLRDIGRYINDAVGQGAWIQYDRYAETSIVPALYFKNASRDFLSLLESLSEIYTSVWKDRIVQAIGIVEGQSYEAVTTEEMRSLINYAPEATGAGQTVIVIDSGIDGDHPDLSDKIAGYTDMFGITKNPYDPYGHGTHVAGLVLKSAPDAQIHAIRVFGGIGTTYTSVIIQALEMAALMPHKVVNCSFGAVEPDDDGINSPLSRAVNQLVSKYGKTVVVASGNEARLVTSPGRAKNALTVGAVDLVDQTARFSGKDQFKPEVMGPGVNMVSALPGGGYGAMSGTSMATPVVAGAAACALSAKPELNGADEQYLIQTRARARQSPGIVDVANTIAALPDYEPGRDPPVEVDRIGSVFGAEEQTAPIWLGIGVGLMALGVSALGYFLHKRERSGE